MPTVMSAAIVSLSLSVQSGAAPSAPSADLPSVRLERVWQDLEFVRPIQVVQRPGDDRNLYVIEQPGRILLGDPEQKDLKDPHVVLDIREKVNDRGNEEGLLSVVFDPEFPVRPDVYLYYSADKPRRAILSRFTVSSDGRTIDPASEQVVYEVSQPYSNHNGGTCLFGPDGFLYLSVGDGGAANDPHDYGQNMKSPLGKILRFDVRTRSAERAYAIPADNPFVGKEGVLPEIWASGLRNVWRMSFDRSTGELWAGDVGQNAWEEIDLIVKGGNYGWNRREGFEPFPPDADHGKEGFIDPVVHYPHTKEGGLSVTGGYVYRGQRFPALVGAYLYADYAMGTVWGLRKNADGLKGPQVLLKKPGTLMSSFGETNRGELLVTGFIGGEKRGNPGRVWWVVADE
jgi:glucose/arabinose dehydrogenase